MSYKILAWKVLAQRVVAVAVEGGVGDWAAYIDAVPGVNHREELAGVIEKGQKLPRDVAIVLFPGEYQDNYRE